MRIVNCWEREAKKMSLTIHTTNIQYIQHTTQHNYNLQQQQHNHNNNQQKTKLDKTN